MSLACLGCLAWLLAAIAAALGLGRAIRLADRRARPLDSEQWNPPEWFGRDTHRRISRPRG